VGGRRVPELARTRPRAGRQRGDVERSRRRGESRRRLEGGDRRRLLDDQRLVEVEEVRH
jgi:hypothetical protein